jgi:hypothetical protein
MLPLAFGVPLVDDCGASAVPVDALDESSSPHPAATNATSASSATKNPAIRVRLSTPSIVSHCGCEHQILTVHPPRR